jgi:hypothetical protein
MATNVGFIVATLPCATSPKKTQGCAESGAETDCKLGAFGRVSQLWWTRLGPGYCSNNWRTYCAVDLTDNLTNAVGQVDAAEALSVYR